MLVFLLIVVGILAIASSIAVFADIANDGYRHFASRRTLHLS